MPPYRLGFLAFLFVISIAVTAQAVSLRGYIGVQSRAFPEEALHGDQGDFTISGVTEFELFQSLPRGSITIMPFARFDSQDEERTHFDLREFFFEIARNNWEFRVGLNRVFWGVTESQHLVDIINQTDFIESPDGEDKLGQPMLNLSFINDWGTIDLFALSGFRVRTFPGVGGRLRFPIVINNDAVKFESADEEANIGGAARFSHYYGPLDIGLSHFHGTSREPSFIFDDSGPTHQLIPYYPIIDQTGFDAQLTLGGWLWKLEAINREGDTQNFAALTGGFELTYVGVAGSVIDIGVISEYLWDDRGKTGTPFDNDIFAGARFSFNDVQSSALLAGVIVDLDHQTSLLRIEGSRRFGANWTAALEVQAGFNADPSDPLYPLRNDAYIELDVSRHF